LAAANALGYESIGIERDRQYIDMAQDAISKLAAVKIK
jgi:site-specific DNA-methyltransferase (adenine-specific)